jgi:hypothetical protein
MSDQTALLLAVEARLRESILAVFLLGWRHRDPGAIVNALVAFAISYLPDAVEAWYDVEFRPWQRVYTATALLTHAAGMLGPYDDTWWWDHLTHTLSASLFGGFVYAVSRRRGHDPRPRVLAATVSVGVLWELLEYAIHWVANRLGLEPVLVPYGPRDTFFDLVFNVFGALLVLVFGDHLLQNFTPEDE